MVRREREVILPKERVEGKSLMVKVAARILARRVRPRVRNARKARVRKMKREKVKPRTPDMAFPHTGIMTMNQPLNLSIKIGITVVKKKLERLTRMPNSSGGKTTTLTTVLPGRICSRP